MKTETITWHEIPADGLPDSDITVLVAVYFPPDPDAAGDTALIEACSAWWSGEHWIDAGSGDRIERKIGRASCRERVSSPV